MSSSEWYKSLTLIRESVAVLHKPGTAHGKDASHAPGLDEVDDIAEQLANADFDGDAFLEWAAAQTPRVSKFLEWCNANKYIKVF